MIFVIGVHTNPKPFSDNALLTLLILQTLYFCNTCFYMLSGELNLQDKTGYDESKDYKIYYLKKLIYIFFPYALMTCVLSLGGMIVHQDKITPFSYIKYTYFSFMDETTPIHLWFIYPLTGMLLSAPFLSKMLRRMADREVKLLFSIGVVWNAVKVYLTADLGFEFGYSGWMLSDWMIVFLAGYFCNRIINEENKKILYLVGGCCFVVNILGGWLIPEHFEYSLQYAPTHLVSTMAFYVFMKTEVTVHGERMKKTITFFAKHSFMIYMIHVVPLRFTPRIVVAQNELIYFFGSVAVTLLVTLIIAAAMNYCFFYPVQKFMKKKLLLPLMAPEKES